MVDDEQNQPGDQEPQATPAERRFKRRIGISLATLAVLGAWIAVLATNAATNESTAARQATRLASESQTADVLSKGVNTGLDQVDAELELLTIRPVFGDAATVTEEYGVATDPDRAAQRQQQAADSLEEALGGDGTVAAELEISANELSLEQQLTVEQRVSWNAKASQYETVLTVLAVAIFLVGFTLVLGRKLRPPVAVPGLILAVICAGWALQIYYKPTPEVAAESISATAKGQYLLGTGAAQEAIDEYDEALEATPDYVEALQARALARMALANPDLLTTLAFTDTSTEVFDAVEADIAAALAAGGDEDPLLLAVASIAAVGEADWDKAATRIEEGIALNELAAELYLWRSAVAVAQGDAEAAEEWLEEAVTRFGDVGVERGRSLAAQYITLLEHVAATTPDQADLAAEFTSDLVAALTANRSDRAGTDASPDARIASATASYDEGITSVNVQLEGLDEQDTIVIAGYENPGGDAGWVQPEEIYYIGPPTSGDGASFQTPRSCVATEYRFDLYVEGGLRDTITVPGAAATC